MNHRIPYGRQDISQVDIDQVIEVLRSEWLTQGPIVPSFEKALASYVGADFAVAVNSATSALHLACIALGLGPGDCLWTSPNTFVASANCSLYCDANVDFVDIDPCTYNMSVKALTHKLELAQRNGKLPKIVVPVHFAGQSCDMEAIYALSKRYGFRIIEDASHAIGGKFLSKPVGICLYSDITVFSFHPVKIITSGEGGMAATNDPELAERMMRSRSHGITSDREKMNSRPCDEIWNYQQIDLGFNYRMTEMQAALGLSQLSRVDQFVAKRHQIASLYDSAFAKLPVILPSQSAKSFSSYHLYPIRIREGLCGKTQRQVYDAFFAMGIGVNLHYIPVYRQPYYEKLGFKIGYCVEAENYYKEAISIPIYPSMEQDQQDYVIDSLQKILQ